MAETAIEWTATRNPDGTVTKGKVWNPIRGCTRVSEGCTNCYAERTAARFSGPGMPYEGLVRSTSKGPLWTGKIRLVPEKLGEPLTWKKPCRVFVNSMSDLFHEGVPDSFIRQVFQVMGAARQHTFQILTKRPERMSRLLNAWQQERDFADVRGDDHQEEGGFPWRNVWLGVSVENQPTADERIPLLLETPAAVRWLSCEPLLGPVTLWDDSEGVLRGPAVIRSGGMTPSTPHEPAEGYDDSYPGINWCVVGGESGPGARPCHPAWARALRDECVGAGVPFFWKQWGSWVPIDQPWEQNDVAPLGPNERWLNREGGHGFHGGHVWRMRNVGKKAAGRQLDGVEWSEYPEATDGG